MPLNFGWTIVFQQQHNGNVQIEMISRVSDITISSSMSPFFQVFVYLLHKKTWLVLLLTLIILEGKSNYFASRQTLIEGKQRSDHFHNSTRTHNNFVQLLLKTIISKVFENDLINACIIAIFNVFLHFASLQQPVELKICLLTKTVFEKCEKQEGGICPLVTHVLRFLTSSPLKITLQQ